MEIMSNAVRQKRLHNPKLSADTKNDHIDNQPQYFQKYAYTNIRDGEPVCEYVRYMKNTPTLLNKYGNQRGVITIPSLSKANSSRRSDSSFSPATTSNYVSKDRNIHELVNLLLEHSESHKITKEGWESLSDAARYDFLYRSSLVLVDLVADKIKNLNDINVIKYKEQQNRLKYAILWKSMATHLRFHFRKERICVTWDAFKFVADHHPRANIRKILRASKMSTYYPEIKGPEVTVIDITDKKYYGWYYPANQYKNLDKYWRDYAVWLKKAVPYATTSTVSDKSSVVPYRRSEYRSVRGPWDLFADFMKRNQHKIPHEDPKKYTDFFSKCLKVSQTLSENDLIALAIESGLEPYSERFIVDPKFGEKTNRGRKPREEQPQELPIIQLLVDIDQILDHYPMIDSPEHLQELLDNQVDDIFMNFTDIESQKTFIDEKLISKGLL